jgi:carbon-monoxide dehydrogenase medium subunit/6-hydroxypseudooxynicotine dehydrogenase subunit alpha
VKPPPFEYARAGSLEEAVDLLAEWGDEAKVLAGGQSLMPLLNFRLARPSYLVDVNPLDDLASFSRDDGALSIGALCRQATVEERREELTGPWGALGDAVPLIGHYPIRTRGTVGGSVAHADPAAELPVVCAAFEAELAASSRAGTRSIAASAFFEGPLMTTLRPDEVLVSVRLPAPPAGAVTGFEEFSERAGDFALASVCAGVGRENGRCSWARIALGGVGPVPLRAPDAERALLGSDLDDEAIAEAARLAAAGCEPSGDFHASSVFRRELVAELTSRLLQRLQARLAASD